ncbi:winged helix-turn-helix domain-containing protein [Streptomyces sp. ISL-43]|uniref:BTAD domain-containing putative transcriptional regulator n=1 Tax=Streptomyces sp. ISL-43 TaxID=2819183 RepID=UPI001BEA1B36|nr:BTAD domain-containing putative transcriptional regulator [Streptomyces sp. ISL-43]MBT2448972.1 winged helix-turn-helix domain-containing protein [Streptomyces sp. ISL-43]
MSDRTVFPPVVVPTAPIQWATPAAPAFPAAPVHPAPPAALASASASAVPLVGPGALTLVIAPAGYGKTTLLAEAAAAFPGPVVHWRPCRDTRDASTVLARLARTREDPPSSAAPTVESVLLDIEQGPAPVLLLVDDVHLVHGNPAEAALEELARLAPPGRLRVVLAGRRMPAVNLTRLELADTRLLTARDLRLGEAAAAAAFPDADPALLRLSRGWPALIRLGRAAAAAGRDPLDAPALRTYLDREVLATFPDRAVRALRRGAQEPPELADEYGAEDCLPLLRTYLARHRPAPARNRSARAAQAARPPGSTDSAGSTDSPDAAAAVDRAPERPLTLRCFRRFEATLDGRPLDWGATRPRVRALARLLAVHAGRPVHREQLMAALWPESPARTAGHGLQTAVSALRSVLEPGQDRGRARVLVRTGEAYMLDLVPGGSCDVQHFEAATAQGLADAARGRADRAAEALARALRLYTGELLPEDGPAEWVVPLRERCRDQAVRAAHTLAEVELARGRAEAAVTAAGHALSLDPFRDAVWRLLIEAHRRAGDPAAARQAERRHARILAALS